jgi:ankyrin repeat protein
MNNYSRVAAEERSHGRSPWSEILQSLSPFRGDRIFRRAAAHLFGTSVHGLQPWLRSVAATRLVVAALFVGFHATAWAQSPTDLRKTVDRALPILQRSAQEFVAKRACVSCHHNILPILLADLAQSRGFTIDPKVLDAVQDKTFRELRGPNALDNAIQVTTLNDPTPNDSDLLMAAHSAGLQPDLITAVYARRLARWQRDGHWVTSDFRPPHSSSYFMTTATAIRAIRYYMPDELRSERDAVIQRARQWLFENHPASTEDAAFRLMGLVWAEASRDQVAAAQRELTAMQKPNGGWAQLRDYEPDAYSTGEALFALREAEVPATDSGLAKGLKFLISTQAQDGTWRVHTRMLSPADVSPKYFTTGFPYTKDEYISYAGTCWAVMSLLSALPASPEKKPEKDSAPADAPAWLRTALFGTSSQLASLLDSGLDPNSKTKSGTTILMAAAADADKVRLLLARRADVKARASSGVDALTIGAAYRGTTASLQLLLDAGVDVQPPDGVRVRNAPLVLASMAGDLDNVKLLLARGAKPVEGAFSEAITFGYADVARTLVKAGADTGFTGSGGINALHWAAITNRASIIPVLVEAKVPVNDMDDNGYTPLMYAATIDFGDTDVLKALLKAGADKSIRNSEGRTPLAQAQHYKHSRLEAALR